MENMVSIWFGNFETDKALEKYTERSYTRDGDGIPSVFCKEFFSGKKPFELELFERYLIEEPSTDIRVLLEGCSYDESVIQSLAAVIGEKLDKAYNAVLLIFDFAADSALAQIRGQVDYIATVPYQREDTI